MRNQPGLCGQYSDVGLWLHFVPNTATLGPLPNITIGATYFQPAYEYRLVGRGAFNLYAVAVAPTSTPLAGTPVAVTIAVTTAATSVSGQQVTIPAAYVDATQGVSWNYSPAWGEPKPFVVLPGPQSLVPPLATKPRAAWDLSLRVGPQSGNSVGVCDDCI